MELWILVFLGLGIAIQLSNIGSELKFLSKKLANNSTETREELSDAISKGIGKSDLAKNIAHEIMISGFDERIGFGVKHSGLDDGIAHAIEFSGLDEKIARELVSELLLKQNFPEKIGKSVSAELGDLRGELEAINANLSLIRTA